MSKILKAERGLIIRLKLIGDIRVNYCHTFDELVQKLQRRKSLKQMVVDLTSTDGLDSTALGSLVYLAQMVIKRFKIRPLLVTRNEEITALVKGMGFEQVYDLCSRNPRGVAQLKMRQLPLKMPGIENVRQQVIDVHRILIELGVPDKEEFQNMVTRLQQ